MSTISPRTLSLMPKAIADILEKLHAEGADGATLTALADEIHDHADRKHEDGLDDGYQDGYAAGAASIAGDVDYLLNLIASGENRAAYEYLRDENPACGMSWTAAKAVALPYFL